MLFTIGYEGIDVDSLVLTLSEAGIQTLIDVRELPLSRKKGFSKSTLSENVAAAGINYIHVRQLGAPKPVRHALKAGGTWEDYCQGYACHLENCKSELDELAQMAKEENICLLCFEADYRECHRSLVAAELEQTRKVPPAKHLRPHPRKGKAATAA